ncbi:O-antigen ligase domain-containing protein [Microcoleus sp. FACHB-1515]|uniref:O-antigen ligase domain-containing protein n=1 Tax=Cyanophyceae TaxID=3028117 RepID=UPI001688FE73|nr:O-antigen ligase domain-containing protein [Microcoleus sp. FACHB-1515]MBD2090416.1 O-antigen ligase domain-containing protein [Microcoleus sp. FACHB-1515]
MGFTFPGNPFQGPNLLVPLVMFAWIPIVFYLFTRFSPRRAVVISFITAWLYLPQAAMSLPGLPEYTKATATSYGILLATFVFDSDRLQSFRLGWLDLPMLVWCLCTIPTSLSNGLGLYDGVSGMLNQLVVWGIPYFLGRIYFSDLAGLRQLAMGIFIGGLTYMPLCLIETRISPQLHRIVYGGHAFADFGQSMRLGGYRPTVFMSHGLAVGAFMMAATLIGIWFWQTGTVTKVWKYPISWWVGALLFTFIMLRSTGAYVNLAIGVGILFAGKYFRTALPAFILIATMCIYLYINAMTGNYFSDQIIETLSQFLEPDRIASLQFRFNNEELLSDKARERIVLGWGGWGRNLIFENGRQKTIPDSLWILAFGVYGLVGLVSLFSVLLAPVFSFFWSRYPARLWTRPEVAPAAALTIALLLYVVDCLVNAMVNPIYILVSGGVAGVVLKPKQRLQPKTAPPVPRAVSSR